MDCSISAQEKDLLPTRLDVCKSAISKFILEFYDLNPISSLALMETRDRIARPVTELSGNSKVHMKPLGEIEAGSGSASLQNILKSAMATLKHVPQYGFKELLIVYNSLSSCDPDDVHATIRECKKHKLRVSCICVAAEVRICKTITEETGGSFAVALDGHHLQDLMIQHTVPPAELQTHAQPYTDFVYMGFPELVFETAFSFAFEGKERKLSRVNYRCPRCDTKTTDIPARCQVCALQLNSSSRIARSHHHLFPVMSFTEVPSDRLCKAPRRCGGCMQAFKSDSMRLECPNCADVFCVNCDIFIHDSLHNCPGCGGAPSQTSSL